MAIRSKIASDAPARHRAIGALIAALAVATIAVPVAAQPRSEDRAVAESLFLQGRQLMEAKNFHDACPKLEESQRIDPAAGTLLNLAVCHEGEKKFATAWGEFRQSLSVAKREQRADREKLCTEHIAAIEPKLSHLVVTVPPGARIPGLVVTRNGATLGEATWGSAIPADAGDDDIQATAPGYEPWKMTVKIVEGRPSSVDVPVLKVATASTTPPAGSAAEPSSPPVVSYVLLGAGVVGIAVGSVFGASALSKKSDSDSHCPGEHCDAQGVSLNDDAKHAARVSDFGFGLGIVALGAGAYLFFANRGGPEAASPAPAPVSFSVMPLPNGGAASLRGAF